MITRESLLKEHISKLEKRIDDALATSTSFPVKIQIDNFRTDDPDCVVEHVKKLYESAGYSVHFNVDSKKNLFLVFT